MPSPIQLTAYLDSAGTPAVGSVTAQGAYAFETSDPRRDTMPVRYQCRVFPARMSGALPQFDAQSRTLKTRFELDNPDHLLQPDMFVDVELHVEIPAALTVPADAVTDSGRRKTVYVDRAGGFFEPRLVKTGWRLGDRVQITAGLEPGKYIPKQKKDTKQTAHDAKGRRGPA